MSGVWRCCCCCCCACCECCRDSCLSKGRCGEACGGEVALSGLLGWCAADGWGLRSAAHAAVLEECAFGMLGKRWVWRSGVRAVLRGCCGRRMGFLRSGVRALLRGTGCVAPGCARSGVRVVLRGWGPDVIEVVRSGVRAVLRGLEEAGLGSGREGAVRGLLEKRGG